MSPTTSETDLSSPDSAAGPSPDAAAQPALAATDLSHLDLPPLRAGGIRLDRAQQEVLAITLLSLAGPHSVPSLAPLVRSMTRGPEADARMLARRLLDALHDQGLLDADGSGGFVPA